MPHRLTPHVPRWLLRRLADPSDTVVPGQTYTFDAAILLLDIVGFTALTERLATRGLRGIEALERVLDAVFGTLVSTVHAFGGDVIRFGGDAITCMWPVEHAEGEGESEETRRLTVQRACAAALDIQAIVSRLDQVDTPLGPATLAMRLGIGYGPAVAFILGSDTQRLWAVAGPALDGAIEAEVAAPPNRVRLHPSAMEQLGETATADAERNLAVLDVPVHSLSIRPPAVDDALLHPFIHPVLVSRELTGPEEFIAEFRPVVPVFVGCETPPDESDSWPERSRRFGAWLNTWVQAAQIDVNRFGGWLSGVEVGDKGNVLVVQFGTPVAHEDDERRAVACALALRETAAALFSGVRPRISVTRGRLFEGPVGSPDRHAYTLVGDEINLAARLMEVAQPGQIIVSGRVRNVTSDYFSFRDMGSVHVRGKQEPVPVYGVLGSRSRRKWSLGQHLASTRQQRLVGRERELEASEVVVGRAWFGQVQVLTVTGEAGIGKSHLVSELLHRWTTRGGTTVGGDCLSFAQETPYLPWRWIVTSVSDALFGGTFDSGLGEERTAQLDLIAQALGRLPPPPGDHQPDHWSLRLPLLAEVLGLEAEENDLTRGLQGQARRDNTFAVIQALLRASADQAPTLVLIEDAHWADDLSLRLATFLASDPRGGRLLLVLVHRPLPSPIPALWQAIRQLPHHTAILLGELTAEASHALVQGCLDAAHVPDELADVVFERAHGHPFFTEEIVHMFRDVGCILVEGEEGENGGASWDARWGVSQGSRHVIFDRQRAANTRFPDTVQGVVQARVDQLAEENKLTLKVASVIGRLFPYRVLAGIYPVPAGDAELQIHLDTSERLGLTLLERLAPELEYIFKHSITHEVVYESLAFAQRRLLHAAVANWYERRYADNLEPYYSLLAYHYGQAEKRGPELHYSLLAADHARRAHAVADAARYYERGLELLDREQEPARTADVLMRLAWGLQYTAQYGQALECLQQALLLYEQVNDPIRAADACFEIADRMAVHDLDEAFQYTLRGLEYVRDRPDAQHQVVVGYSNVGYFHRSRGNYEEAKEALQYALNLAQEADDLDGLWQCYRSLSLFHYSRGQKQAALEAGVMTVRYVEQAGAPVQHRIIALNNQACFAQDVGDPEAAIETGEAGLALARRSGVVSEQVILASTLAGIYNHVGDWDMAEQVLNEGLRLLAQRPHPYHEVALYVEAGNIAYGRGDWEQAIEHWGRAEEKSRAGTQQAFTAELCVHLATAWAERGDLEQAERWSSTVRALAEEREQQGALAASYRAQGMIERARGNWKAGERAFERGLALARELDAPVEATRTLLEYGLLLVAAGRVEEGWARLREAEEQATGIGLRPVAQAAREALRATMSA